ncbi:MAG: hypothetical protein KA007_02565 [Candidatus Pacebacteria bacterium]|jgi:hypothetical protein|nr:hypothetical protein [Candidatus Paceibacterota bacterium]
MIHTISQITTPYFDTRLSLWIFRGFTFENKGIEFLFLQTLDVFGSRTNWVEISQRWKLYKVDDDATLKCMTGNGIETDASFMKKDDNSDSISRRNGLTPKDIEKLETHAKKESLQHGHQVNNAVITEIQPLLEKQVLVIEEAMEKLETLAISDLVKTMNEINDLGSKIHAMYPRSNEELRKRALKVRETYAKAKYPELYAELKKMHDDQNYEQNDDDDIVEFGTRSIYGSLFYQYFMKSPTSTWENRSPFEGQFEKSILFKEMVAV